MSIEIDVAKAQLEFACRPDGETGTFAERVRPTPRPLPDDAIDLFR